MNRKYLISLMAFMTSSALLMGLFVLGVTPVPAPAAITQPSPRAAAERRQPDSAFGPMDLEVEQAKRNDAARKAQAVLPRWHDVGEANQTIRHAPPVKNGIRPRVVSRAHQRLQDRGDLIEHLYDTGHDLRHHKRMRERAMHFQHSRDNPFEFYSPAELEEIERNRRGELRGWSKDTMKSSARVVVRGADQESAPVRLLRKLKGIFGRGDLFHNDGRRNDAAEPDRLTVRRSDYEARRRSERQDPHYLFTPRNREAGEVDTRIRAKMNLGRRMGELRLQNPIATIGAHGDMRARDKVQLRARKEVRSIGLQSGLDYGLENKTINMIVNQKLSERINAELQSRQSEHPEIAEEQRVQLNYHLQF